MAQSVARHLVMLLVCFGCMVGYSSSRAHLLNPSHFGSMVQLEGSMIYLPESLTKQCANDTPYDEVRDDPLCKPKLPTRTAVNQMLFTLSRSAYAVVSALETRLSNIVVTLQAQPISAPSVPHITVMSQFDTLSRPRSSQRNKSNLHSLIEHNLSCTEEAEVSFSRPRFGLE